MLVSNKVNLLDANVFTVVVVGRRELVLGNLFLDGRKSRDRSYDLKNLLICSEMSFLCRPLRGCYCRVLNKRRLLHGQF